MDFTFRPIGFRKSEGNRHCDTFIVRLLFWFAATVANVVYRVEDGGS